jgi:hypothetical protein
MVGMMRSPITGFETPYKLLRRFEALIESIFALNATIRQLSFVRYKPIFATYISCIEQFKSSFPEEYGQLDLGEISLYDADAKEQFTANRLSTVLHQAQAVVGVLKGLLPPTLMENPGGTTVVVSSQAASQSSATSTVQVQFTLVMQGLSQAIQESNLDKQTKAELAEDINELEKDPRPSESKIKSFAAKFANKLLEVGQDIAIGVIERWLKSQIPQ